jgi:transglutaminase-like putative cysteine protease
MNPTNRLSDSDHPAVAQKAAELTREKGTSLEKLEAIFHFVRDGVPFGFTPSWDNVKASQVMAYGLGYCNTKATLFVALCRAAGLPARVHFGLIDIRIMRGVLPSFAFPFLPKLGGHSWTDVQLEGEWKSIDSYIDDQAFYPKALQRLKRSGRALGYSVSFKDGKSSCEFNFGEQGFLHMGAVMEDHGAWEDSAEYFATSRYPRLSAFQLMLYPMLARLANRNIAAIRQGAG